MNLLDIVFTGEYLNYIKFPQGFYIYLFCNAKLLSEQFMVAMVAYNSTIDVGTS